MQACLGYKIILGSGYKIVGTKGECRVGVEMKWVHLQINTRVRMLGCLGCIGAFSRRAQQHAQGSS